MTHLLIAPWSRKPVSHLGKAWSLAARPLLGQGLVEYWLGHLACSGLKDVGILNDDKPGAIETLVGTGARWGISIKLIEESRELTAAQAFLKYEKQLKSGTTSQITVMDHFPGQPEKPLFAGYKGFYEAMMDWLPRAVTPERVGARQIRPGVWVGVHAHVSEDAELVGPCWIGSHAYIGAKTVIGPNAIIEDGGFVESISAITNSIVGPDTFVGQCAEISGSIALGNTLVNVDTESAIEISDEFVLCALRRPRALQTAGWFERLSEVCARNKAEANVLWRHFLMNREG